MTFIGVTRSGRRLYKAPPHLGLLSYSAAFEFAQIYGGEVQSGSELGYYPKRWYVTV